MTKEEINEKIFELQTDEEIMDFIKARLDELKNNTVEKTVGQNYTDSFQDYISEKIHYKAADKIDDSECPDLVYDDITPYFELIKSIKKGTWYNELLLFSKIFFAVDKYLPNDDRGMGRALTYFSHKDKKLSIKTISENAVAFCSEKAGMAHNMFKFLGIDSKVICGAREGELHCYNFIYPKGYGNFPTVLFDPSFFVNFCKGNEKILCGFYKSLTETEAEDIKNGLPIQIDLTRTETAYRKLYGSSGILDGYEFQNDSPIYIYGLENAKNYISSIPTRQ